MGWLTGWSYRKSHVINYAAGAGTLYQKKIIVHYGSGSDSGDNVYLNFHCKTDFGDVRFTGSDGTTLLDYWMESKVDSDNAVFWVEVADDLSTVAATVYVYYGNSTATTTSNGTNTFVKFTDFQPLTSLPADWTTEGTINVSVTNKLVASGSGTSTGGEVRTTGTVTLPNLAVRFRGLMNSGSVSTYGYGEFGFETTGFASGFGSEGGFAGTSYNSAAYTGLCVHSGAGKETFDTDNKNTLVTFEVRIISGHSYLVINEVQRLDQTSNIPTGSVYVGSWIQSNGGTHNIYWVAVRKFVSPEPANGAWGTEELPPQSPTVTTQDVSNIEETTSTGSGNITNTGGENCDKRGVCWNTTGNPTVSDSKSEESGSFGTGSFSESMTSLSPGTLYYVKAYAHNSAGYGYGSQVSFTTKPNDPSGLTSTGRTKNSISLSWTKGTGAEKTMIRYRTDTYPTSPTDGTQGYFDTGTSTTVSSLSVNQIYYFRAWSYKTGAPNSGYSDGYSSTSDYTKPDDPSNLNCNVISNSEIDLTWTKGTGGDKTMIRRKVGSYPTSVSDGDQAYFDTGSSYNNTGLNSSTHYFYRAWAYSSTSGYYSDGYSSDDDTTLASTLPTGKLYACDKANRVFRIDPSTMSEEKCLSLS